MSELGEVTACWTITFHRKSKHSATRVWEAITDPAFVARWWNRGPARIDVRVGGDYYVDFGDGNCLDGVIVRFERGELLRVVWGLSVLEWTMKPEGEGCLLTFMDNGSQPPPEGADWTSAGAAAGYHQGLDELEMLLDGAQVASDSEAWDGRAWAGLRDAYRPLIAAITGRAPGET
jgi:uncharacterized protein YndB with AHSA1/START domain